MPLPKIILTQQVDDFIREVVQSVHAEVGGVGLCKVEDGAIVVDHAYLVPQKVSGAKVEFDDNAMLIAMEKAIELDRNEDLRFSWHSHGDLPVSWSHIDEDGIDSYLTQAPWLASMVVNRDGDRTARIDINGVPLVGRVKFEKVGVEVSRVLDPDSRASREIVENVTIQREKRHLGWHPGSRRNGRTAPRTIIERVSGGNLPARGIHDLTTSEFEDAFDGDVDGGVLVQGVTLEDFERLEDAGYNIRMMDVDECIEALGELDFAEHVG